MSRTNAATERLKAMTRRAWRAWQDAEGDGSLTVISWMLLAGVAGGLGWAGAERFLGDDPDLWNALVFTFACLSALVVLEVARLVVLRRGRRKVRETGSLRLAGRDARPEAGERLQPAGAEPVLIEGVISAAAQAQIDALRKRMEQQEAWQREVDIQRKASMPKLDAIAGIVREVCEGERLQVPPELQVSQPTLELPPLWLAWDAKRSRGA